MASISAVEPSVWNLGREEPAMVVLPDYAAAEFTPLASFPVPAAI